MPGRTPTRLNWPTETSDGPPQHGYRPSMAAPGKTRDHHVPRMYLRRFAKARGNGHQIAVSNRELTQKFHTNVRDVAVESGFYWGTDSEGVPQHHMEQFLSVLEGDATPAFRALLDSGKDLNADALRPWPPRTSARHALSWWISAQILRTVRQRSRLHVEATRGGIDLPDRVAVANHHLRYIAEMVQPLAATLYGRPWGIGFADYCLLTGDVPALVLNGQDHGDQLSAVAYWDVYLPLDPHRCLYLPGAATVAADRRLRADHRFKLHGGHSLALNTAIMDASVRHVFFHPDHDPTPKAEPARSLESEMPRVMLAYEVLPPDAGVQRRWLDVHPEAATAATGPRMSEDEVVTVAERMVTELERRERQFERLTAEGP